MNSYRNLTIKINFKDAKSRLLRVQAKEEIRKILVECAMLRIILTYTALVARIKSVKFHPRSKKLAILMTEISREEYLAGRGLLSALVVHKDDGLPGDGFYYQPAIQRDVIDPHTSWSQEKEKVFQYWN